MNTAEEHIQNIYQKLQELIKKYNASKKENEALKNSVSALKENEKNFIEKINLLETQNHILKASAGNMSSAEKNEFDKKINAFMKNIDACITMLNN